MLCCRIDLYPTIEAPCWIAVFSRDMEGVP
jgi:hypothetical protein